MKIDVLEVRNSRIRLPRNQSTLRLHDCSEPLVWTRDVPTNNLLLYEPDDFNRLSERLMQLGEQSEAAALQRFFLGFSREARVWKSGDIEIPYQLVSCAEIEDQVVLLERNDRHEVWAPHVLMQHLQSQGMRQEVTQ